MHVSRLVCCFLSAALVSSLSAQRTWVVDGNGGPGVDFTDLPAAVAAASPGDTLRVRAGRYSAIATSKGLTLLGEGNPLVSWPVAGPTLSVTDLPAGARFVMQGISVMSRSTGILLDRNQGCVCLEGPMVVTDGGDPQASTAGAIALLARSCAAVFVRKASLQGVQCEGSTLLLSDASIHGRSAGQLTPRIWPAAIGLRLDGSRLVMAGGEVGGGSGSSYASGSAAAGIVANSSRIVATGSAVIRAGSVAGTGVPAPAIQASALTAELDPSVALVPSIGAVPVAGGAVVTTRSIASLSAGNALLGGSLSITLASCSGDPFAILGGTPTAPAPLFDGLLVVDPFASVLLASGTQGTGGTSTFVLSVPNLPLLAGLPFTMQAGSLSATANVLGLSSPVVTILR